MTSRVLLNSVSDRSAPAEGAAVDVVAVSKGYSVISLASTVIVSASGEPVISSSAPSSASSASFQHHRVSSRSHRGPSSRPVTATPGDDRSSTSTLSERNLSTGSQKYQAYSSDEELEDYLRQPKTDYTYSRSISYNTVAPQEVGPPNMSRRPLRSQVRASFLSDSLGSVDGGVGFSSAQRNGSRHKLHSQLVTTQITRNINCNTEESRYGRLSSGLDADSGDEDVWMSRDVTARLGSTRLGASGGGRTLQMSTLQRIVSWLVTVVRTVFLPFTFIYHILYVVVSRMLFVDRWLTTFSSTVTGSDSVRPHSDVQHRRPHVRGGSVSLKQPMSPATPSSSTSSMDYRRWLRGIGMTGRQRHDDDEAEESYCSDDQTDEAGGCGNSSRYNLRSRSTPYQNAQQMAGNGPAGDAYQTVIGASSAAMTTSTLVRSGGSRLFSWLLVCLIWPYTAVVGLTAAVGFSSTVRRMSNGLESADLPRRLSVVGRILNPVVWARCVLYCVATLVSVVWWCSSVCSAGGRFSRGRRQGSGENGWFTAAGGQKTAVDGVTATRLHGAVYGGSVTDSAQKIAVDGVTATRLHGAVYGGSVTDSAQKIAVDGVTATRLHGAVYGGSDAVASTRSRRGCAFWLPPLLLVAGILLVSYLLWTFYNDGGFADDSTAVKLIGEFKSSSYAVYRHISSSLVAVVHYTADTACAVLGSVWGFTADTACAAWTGISWCFDAVWSVSTAIVGVVGGVLGGGQVALPVSLPASSPSSPPLPVAPAVEQQQPSVAAVEQQQPSVAAVEQQQRSLAAVEQQRSLAAVEQQLRELRQQVDVLQMECQSCQATAAAALAASAAQQPSDPAAAAAATTRLQQLEERLEAHQLQRSEGEQMVWGVRDDVRLLREDMARLSAEVVPRVQTDVGRLQRDRTELRSTLIMLQDSLDTLSAAVADTSAAAGAAVDGPAAAANWTTELDSRINELRQQLLAQLVAQGRDDYVAHLSDGAGAMSATQVRRLVVRLLADYDADKTGRFDYARESAGGWVVSTKCTEPHNVQSAELSILGIPLWYPSNNARTILQPVEGPGKCFAFGGPGYFVIALSHRIRPSEFVLEHVPRNLTPTANISSAPRGFSVMALSGPDDSAGVELGRYEFDAEGQPLQLFGVADWRQLQPVDTLELRVHSNWGHPQYTCLYRFRVHGVPPDDSEQVLV